MLQRRESWTEQPRAGRAFVTNHGRILWCGRVRSDTQAMRALTLLVAVLLLSAPTATAAAEPDPYVDAVAPANQVPVTDPENLVGPPDDRFATVSGRFAKFLVLDLGAGEEGVGDLEVRFHHPVGTLAQTMDVHFLDANGQRLSQGQLIMIGAGTRVTTVTNLSTRPYRYLKILTGVQTARFDSMRAGAPAAAADWPWCWPAPTPGTGWDLVTHGYHSCARCQTAGEAGIINGDWTTYRCGTFPVGLDVVYNLYKPSSEPMSVS